MILNLFRVIDTFEDVMKAMNTLLKNYRHTKFYIVSEISQTLLATPILTVDAKFQPEIVFVFGNVCVVRLSTNKLIPNNGLEASTCV